MEWAYRFDTPCVLTFFVPIRASCAPFGFVASWCNPVADGSYRCLQGCRQAPRHLLRRQGIDCLTSASARGRRTRYLRVPSDSDIQAPFPYRIYPLQRDIKALRGAFGEACRPAWFTGRSNHGGRRKESSAEGNFFLYCSQRVRSYFCYERNDCGMCM